MKGQEETSALRFSGPSFILLADVGPLHVFKYFRGNLSRPGASSSRRNVEARVREF